MSKASVNGEWISKGIIIKIFTRITSNHSVPQSLQQTEGRDIQEEMIIMSLNLPYLKDNSEKQCCKLITDKIKSTFHL